NVLVQRRWQKVEHSAAVVVADDNRRPEPVASQRPQAVHVVIQRQVAEEKDRRSVWTAGREPDAGGNQAVDAACAAVAEKALLRLRMRPEAVGRANRHARTDEDLRRVR